MHSLDGRLYTQPSTILNQVIFVKFPRGYLYIVDRSLSSDSYLSEPSLMLTIDAFAKIAKRNLVDRWVFAIDMCNVFHPD